MDALKKYLTNIPVSKPLVFIILFVSGLIAYWPAINGDFLWDDTFLVGINPFFKSPIFLLEVFRHYLFMDNMSAYYRPVQNISYMLDYWLWFKTPAGYHLANIFYHTLSAFLIFLLLRALLPSLVPATNAVATSPPAATRNDFLAFLVAFVWVVHPIHNAAVAYVAGRADSLACVFALSGWLLYMRSIPCRSLWAKYLLCAIAMLCGLLALCSKEIAMLWMALFLFYLFFFDREKRLRHKIIALLSVIAVLAACSLLRHFATGSGASAIREPMPLLPRLMLVFRALGDYTGLIFYPSVLHMDRNVFNLGFYASRASWQENIRYEYLSIIGAAMIAAFILMGKSRLPGRRLRLFAIGWFFIGFLPISNLFPLNAQVAEHWIYMPSVGFLLFLGGCVLAMPKKWHLPIACLTLVAIVPLTLRTRARSKDWADTESFYRSTISNGGGTARINLNLALIYLARKDYATAEKMFRNILKMNPDYMPARLNFGMALHQMGKDQEAAQYLNYDKTKLDSINKEYTHTWSAERSMAGMAYQAGKYDEALSVLNDAILRHPEVWELVQFKAQVLEKLGKLPDAIANVKTFADSHWWHYESHMALAALQWAGGAPDAAIATYRHAALLDIHQGDPWFSVAIIDANNQRMDEAIDAQKKGLARNPYQIKQYLVLAALLDAANRKQEAQDVLKHAEELRQNAAADTSGPS